MSNKSDELSPLASVEQTMVKPCYCCLSAPGLERAVLEMSEPGAFDNFDETGVLGFLNSSANLGLLT